MRRFENPLNLIILTGFICQGLFNESLLILTIFVALWFLCLIFRQKKEFIHPVIEFLILFASLAISLKFAGDDIFSKCFSLGNGLIALQCTRMLRPIDRRAKYYALSIALTQTAVGSQVILGYGFIIVIAAIFLLLPKTLFNLNSENSNPSFDFFSRDGYWLINHKTQYLIIAVFTILFFLFFPRIKLFNTLGIYGRTKPVEMLQPSLETSLGSGVPGEGVMFRVYADEVSYLKLFALDTFDGNIWNQSPASYLANVRFKGNLNDDDIHYRKVEIADSGYTSKFLPSDGYVTRVKGNFFRDSFLTSQGNIVVHYSSQTSNKYYEYYTAIPEPYIPLTSKDIQRYLQHPEISEKLREFAYSFISKNSTPQATAKSMELYLQKNCVYELGAPDLKSEAPVDDFIFNEKRGHCERFASALALLLRINNIPSRVVIGYYTTAKNDFGDFYSIRNSNAHAWVEAFFEDKGWTILDPTPADLRRSMDISKESLITLLNDFIEYIWYSKIVNFTASDQNLMLKSISEFFKDFFLSVRRFNYLRFIFPVSAAIILIVLVFILIRTSGKKSFRKSKRAPEINLKYANHFYSSMISILSKKNLRRTASMTPLEFQLTIEKAQFPLSDETGLLTEYFCKVKYAEIILSDKEKKEIDKALLNLKNSRHKKDSLPSSYGGDDPAKTAEY